MSTTTNYIWDDENLLAESDETDAIGIVYTNEPQQYGNVVSTKISETPSYHHFDGIGSTRQLTDAAGAVTDRMTYDAWGNQIARAGSTGVYLLWIGEFSYYYDVETGLYHIHVRPYGPNNARWTTIDPLWNLIAEGKYGYSSNSPVNNVDPSGNKPAKPGKPAAKPAKKTIPFKACCSFTRFCDANLLFGYGPETKVPYTVSCELAAGVKPTPVNLSLAANQCCAANKPSGNWNPCFTCTDWIGIGVAGNCGKGGIVPAPCANELAAFFNQLNNWNNGTPPGEPSPTPDGLWLECRALCECMFGASTAPAKICMEDGFCGPVLGAASPPVEE